MSLVSLYILLFGSTINGPITRREMLPPSQFLALGVSELDAHLGLFVPSDWLGLWAFGSPTWGLSVSNSDSNSNWSFSGLPGKELGWGITMYPLSVPNGRAPRKSKRGNFVYFVGFSLFIIHVYVPGICVSLGCFYMLSLYWRFYTDACLDFNCVTK